ncbi:MAG: hypothetical protein CM15mP74_16970 [Halieaceae bacterium]|nr:MAG: hypothetical protein CM15mP74_16970 [Halieaceae bacterium]
MVALASRCQAAEIAPQSALTGMTNGMDYACELTAFDNTVVPTRGSQTVIMGDVTPTNSPTT